MKTSEKIIKYIKENSQTSAPVLVELLEITDRAVRKQLKLLVEEGVLSKSGKPPKVFYSIAENISQSKETVTIDREIKKVVDANFLYVTPMGQRLEGWTGFITWCQDRQLDVVKMAKSYLKTLEKYSVHKKSGLIDGMEKMKSTFEDIALDEVFYLDFYSMEIFGKTKLGQLLLFAKQSQDKKLMNQMIDEIKPAILKVIDKYKIDGVVYIPPTVKREYQLMRQIEKRLNLDLRIIPISKIKTPIIVPQKTLNKLGDRVINARETIIIETNGNYKNILLIDDAVGSGATLNETAKKIRQKDICKGKIIGLAITGSAKGFDVISEV